MATGNAKSGKAVAKSAASKAAASKSAASKLAAGKSGGVKSPARCGAKVAGKAIERTNAAMRRAFLDELASSANVTAAAKVAGMTTTAAYRQRSRDAGFRGAWHAALCEGYARLETELLAEALAPATTRASDELLKARQYRQRLALALLAAHRASVRGERAGATAVMADETKGAKARLTDKIDAMAARCVEAESAKSDEGAAAMGAA